jgi:hypothetical protein
VNANGPESLPKGKSPDEQRVLDRIDALGREIQALRSRGFAGDRTKADQLDREKHRLWDDWGRGRFK